MRHYALAEQMIALGLITRQEERTGQVGKAAMPLSRKPRAEAIPGILAAGGPSSRVSDLPRGFAVGDKVRARTMTPGGHTRLPRYARGRMGEITAVHGTHVFPDSSAEGLGDDPQWLYTVRFTARELWGKDPGDAVCIDLWEPYLERQT
jgi:nitrile hydratase